MLPEMNTSQRSYCQSLNSSMSQGMHGQSRHVPHSNKQGLIGYLHGAGLSDALLHNWKKSASAVLHPSSRAWWRVLLYGPSSGI